MPIDLSCDCGRALRVKDELAGKRIRCPECKSILAVPENEIEMDESGLEVLDDEETPGYGSRRAAIQAEPPKSRTVRRRTVEDDAPYDDPPPRRRPRPRRNVERRAPRVAFERGWFGSVNAGIAGGVLMILIAGIWFTAGLTVGYIFFFPPILAVIGFIAIIKGCVNS